MYDFYGKPPKTRADLRAWRTSWLVKVETPDTIILKDGTFVQTLAFVRAGYIHSVFRHVSADVFIWSVISRDDPLSAQTFPTQRYASYEELLEGVINEYAIAWNLEFKETPP